MDALHQAYVAFTENWWLVSFAVSCGLALVLLLKQVPLSTAIVTLALSGVLTIGWLILDLALYPGSHNLLPFEAALKLVLVGPLAASLLYKVLRGQSPT